MSMIPYNNFEWFKRFFDPNYNYNLMRRGRPSNFFDIDPLREFEESMNREMNEMFDQFEHISKNSPKELIREYETPEGEKVREIGPLVYGYSMTIGPDGKPKVTEFGNIKHPSGRGMRNIRGTNTGYTMGPQITAEREPLADVSVMDNEIKVVIEMPGVKKENIKINARDGEVEVLTNDAQRKYHRILELPRETDIDTAKSTYNNGILEVRFNKKKKEAKPTGKEIKID
ncbi:archaeal heat shock protein Hsp20 [Candidatus Nitrosocosmicus sp. FF01]|uniref:archaeal heat shock protein Hsp20 n=1 Tax=Candidatus Nitrosocosmicus sp. FF01 TaxID=3397670 RepID=UPI0039ECF5BD